MECPLTSSRKLFSVQPRWHKKATQKYCVALFLSTSNASHGTYYIVSLVLRQGVRSNYHIPSTFGNKACPIPWSMSSNKRSRDNESDNAQADDSDRQVPLVSGARPAKTKKKPKASKKVYTAYNVYFR